MARANKERGEHPLELGGVAYRLRPSFEANVAIEDKTGRSLIELHNAGIRGSLSLMQLGVIASEWIKAGAEEKDELTKHVAAEGIAKQIQEAGQIMITLKLTGFLAETINAGRDASGEARAASI